MAEVYSKSTRGGVTSDRFRAYVEAGRCGLPVHGYNPMTSEPVLETIEALIGVDAEARLHEVANRAAGSLGHDQHSVMYLTVATPGMWTDRLATEVEHRLLAKQPGSAVLWVGEPIEPAALDAEFAAQTVRRVHHCWFGAPRTLASAVRQEGLAGAYAGVVGQAHPGAAEVLEVLADDSTFATQVAFMYGDDAASVMGFSALGVSGRTGFEHAVAMHADQTVWRGLSS